MTKDEALKMVIEALEFIKDGGFYTGHDDCINACKEALEQPAPPEKTTSLEDVIKEFEKDPEMKALLDLARKQVKGMELEQPAQEPYGWYDNHDIYTEKQSDESIALYTHPQQWQGLTDDEIDKIYYKTFDTWSSEVDIDFAHAIEQALKDKNKC